MITSNGNQYLPPDYFSPLPTSLDAKKSPLALLAQTCSQIGTDAPNAKSVLNSSSSSSSSSSSTSSSSSESKLSKNQREKSSPSSSSNGSSPVTSKSSFKPYESCLKSSDTKCAADEKKPTPVRLPSAQTSQDTTNHSGRSVCSPSSSPGTRRTPVSQQDTQPSSRPQSNPTAVVVTSSPSSNAAKNTTSDPISSLKSLSLPTSSAHNYIPNYPSLPLDVMVSSLLSSHHMKAGMNPYLNYNRLKTTAAGADGGILPLCRDPYCSSCQLSSHILAASAQNGKSCPAGCTQCDIGKSSANLLSGSHGTTLAAAYAQAQLAALAAASQMPHVCSWVGGDATYCGKRFLTSEELLQHLRTHTSSETLLNMSTHSLLNRTYPTPPLSPLSTARYHPYSKPPFLTPSLFPLQPNPAALHPGFSPYLFYNAKLGSTPHP